VENDALGQERRRMATPKLPPTWRITFINPDAWAISVLEISVSASATAAKKACHGDPA